MAKEFDDVQLDVEFEPAANHNDNLVSKENISLSFGKIAKWKTDFHSSVWSGYGLSINGHTISIVEGGTSSSVDIPDDFADEKVKQTNSSGNEDYRILFSASANDTTSTEGARKNTSLKYNPSSKILYTPSIYGNNAKLNATIYNISHAIFRSTSKEIVIQTGIKWVSSTHMPVVHLYGYAYGLQSPIELKIGFYIYNNNIGYCGTANMGAWKPDIYLFKYIPSGDSQEYVAIGLVGSIYFPQYAIDVQDEMGGLAGINKDSNVWKNNFYAESGGGNIPTPDNGVTCIKVPYKQILTPAGNLKFKAGSTDVLTYDGSNSSDQTLTIASGDLNGQVKVNTSNVTVYTHPSYTAASSGFYKVTVDATGHVSATTAVVKSDITSLGIPGGDTTYSAGTGLTLNGTAFNHSNSVTAVTSAVFKKITYDSEGHITGTAAVTSADLPAHDHNRVVGVASSTAVPGNVGTTGHVLFHYNVNGNLEDNMPVANNANAIISISKHNGNYTSQLGFSSNGKLYYRSANGETIVGKTWNEIAFAGHTHSTYVLKAGDTMTGSLTMGTANQAAVPTVGITIQDIRSATIEAGSGPAKAMNMFFTNKGTPDANWWSVIHMAGWSTDYNKWEVAGPSHNSDQRTTPLYVRSTNKNTAWGSWRKIYDTSNPPTASEVGAAAVDHTHTEYLPITTTYAKSTTVNGAAYNVDVTVTNPTSQTDYGMIFVADPNTTEANTLRKNSNFRFRNMLGTTSAEGKANIILGNNIAKGTANNETGRITLYADTTHWVDLVPISGMSADRVVNIPDKNGTIALTSDIVTYSFATGDEAGTIKVTPSGGTASNVRVHGLSHIAGDSTGMGIILQASGLTMVGAGESATALQSALSLGGATELLYLSSDQHIHFYTNCQTIADRRHILELKNNGNAAFDGNITVSGNVYNLLELKRTDSANGAGIKFYNNNGLLGSICMTGTADGGLKRYKSDDSTSYTFLDTGNFSISRSLTSGTKIATITVNGTATDLYCQTNTNTDTMVTQTATSTDANYEVLFSGTADSTTRTEGARKSTGLKFNPNYKRLTFDAWEYPEITGATVDLNSYTDASGNYKYRRFRCITTGGGSNISNKPADSPFVLEVILIRWASSTDYITKQIYHCYNKKTYQRFCTNGTWDAWTEIKTTDTNTTYTFATGSTQGAFTVTPAGGTAQTVKIHDLGNIYTTATNHNASDDLDWNLYVNNGWHMAANAANSPDSSVTWWIGIVSRHNEKYITQDVWSFTDSANNIAKHYVRRKVNNVWGQWNEVKYTDTTYGAEKGISLTSGKFGHSNTAITALTTAALKKITYDAYGHITGTAAVAAADLPSHTHLYAKSETAGGPAYSVAGSAGTDDVERRVWFSTSSDSERRAYDDDFTYNPSKNNLKVGGIKSGRTTSTYLAGNQGSVIIESLATAGAYVMLAKMNSTNGVFTHGTYQTRYELHYTSNTTINAGTNSVDKNVTLLDESGNAVWPGHIRSNTRLIAYSATSSAALQSGHLIIGSTSSAYNASGDGGNGGDVAMEFWRGKSASWQILNSGGNLYFRTNYKDSAAQSSYSVTSFSIAHSSGDLTFTGIANFNNHINFATVTSTTYPALSKKIVFNGSTDGADIYYRVDASDAGRLVLNLRDDSNTKICFALNGTDFATIDTSGVYSGTATTATNAVNAKVTVTNPTEQTNYGVLFAADPNTTENNVLRKNNNFRFREVLGTTSAEGAADIILGNNVAKGTANNLTGTIILYGDGIYNTRIMPASGLTAHRTITIPNKGGTFALTSDIVTYSAGTGLSLSGTTFNHSNSITAVTTAVFKKFTYDAQGHITGSAAVAAADLPSHTHSYLPLTGGTVTGAITYKTTLDASLANNGMSSGTGYPTTFNILDKNDKIMVRTEGNINSNGNIGWYAYVRNYNTSGTQVAQKGLSFNMDKSGNLTWKVDDAAAFKTAIGNPERTVRQSVTTTTNYRPILVGVNNAATRTGLTTTVDGESYISDNFFVQPSSGSLYATNLIAHTEGTGTVYLSLWRNGGRSFHIENVSGTMYIKTNYAYNSTSGGWDKTSDGAYSTEIYKSEVRTNKSTPYTVFSSTIEANQTIVAKNQNGIRLQYGSYGFIMRNDGGTTYFLLTDSGGQETNTWNSLRPFAVNNSTGQVQMNNNLFLNGCQLIMSRNSRTNQPIKIPPNTTDITNYGNENGSLMVMGFAGCTVMSAGEVGDGIINEIKNSTDHSFLLQADAQQPYTGGSELAIVASDGPVVFMVNGNTYANRKSVVLDNSMNLYPISKDTGSIGHTNYHWGSGYINDLNVKKIASAGTDSSWVTGMDNAVVRMTTSDSKYRPILAFHTETGGFWALGNHTGDNLLFTFVTAANYSSKTNTATSQIGISNDNRIYIGGANSRQTSLYGDGLKFKTTSASGWVMGMKVVKNSDSSDLGSMGFYGGANTLSYAFIGTAYNDYSLSVPINATGTIKIRGTSPTITHEYVNGSTTTAFNGRLPHISADFEMRRHCLNVDDNSTFSSKPWHKFASVELNGFGLDASAIFLVSNTWGDVPNLTGILIAHIRTVNDNADKTANKAANTYHLRWLVKAPNIDSTRFKLVCIDPGNRTNPVKVELWLKIGGQWEGWTVKLLHEFQRSASPYPLWNLHEIYGNGSANPTTATDNKTCDSSTLNPSLIQDVNVTQTTNLNIVRPLLIAASSANPSNTYQSSSSASAESRSTSTSYNGAINMTGGAYIKTRQWTSGGSQGKTYTTLCAGSFEATDPNGQFVGLASKAYADEDGKRIRDTYGLKTDKLYQSSTTTLSSMSNPVTVNPGTLSTYDFLTIVIKSDASGATYHMVQIPALDGFHQVPLTGNAANTQTDPIVAGGCIQVTSGTNTITLQIYSTRQYNISTSVTKVSTAKVFKIYRVYGTRV